MLFSLVVAAVLLFCSLLIYAVAMQLIVRLVVAFIRSGAIALNFWKGFALMTITMLITAVGHLAQITLWALAFRLCGELSTFETAFYFSAQSYTSLGYGDVQLSPRWRLLGPLEAIDGLLFFGLSTAVLFAILSSLITSRLNADAAHQSGNQGPRSLAGGPWPPKP
jgi:Ion channel